MINKDRIIQQFTKLVSIDSVNLREREMCEYLAQQIKEMGCNPMFDGASKKINGN